MTYIADFDGRFKDRKFKSSSNTDVLTCIGYGDNGSNGNPFWIGAMDDPNTKNTIVKTELMKNCVFLPTVAPTAV